MAFNALAIIPIRYRALRVRKKLLENLIDPFNSQFYPANINFEMSITIRILLKDFNEIIEGY